MTQPTQDNPFQTPTVLEQIPPPRSERESSIHPNQLPRLVAVTWMLFLFSATIHGMAALYSDSTLWGFIALFSVLAGYVVLYPSMLAWGLGLGYAFLMATVCLSVSVTTHYVELRPAFFDITPLVMYLGIMGLLVTSSRYYVFGQSLFGRPITDRSGSADEEEG